MKASSIYGSSPNRSQFDEMQLGSAHITRVVEKYSLDHLVDERRKYLMNQSLSKRSFICTEYRKTHHTVILLLIALVDTAALTYADMYWSELTLCAAHYPALGLSHLQKLRSNSTVSSLMPLSLVCKNIRLL